MPSRNNSLTLLNVLADSLHCFRSFALTVDFSSSCGVLAVLFDISISHPWFPVSSLDEETKAADGTLAPSRGFARGIGRAFDCVVVV